MKFYYNNKLIRSSANHIYTHAVIDTVTGKCEGCRASHAACQSIIAAKINNIETVAQNYRSAIKAIDRGQPRYPARIGKTSYREAVKYTREEYEALVKKYEDRAGEVAKTWQIVKLEARER